MYSSHNHMAKSTDQCDQIWLCLKVLCNKFSYKSSHNIRDFEGYLEKHPISSKKCSGYFLGNFLIQYLVKMLNDTSRRRCLKRVAKQSHLYQGRTSGCAFFLLACTVRLAYSCQSCPMT